MFEKVSEFIYVKSRGVPWLKPDAAVIRTINYLNPADDIKESYKAFEIKRISLSLLILSAGIILSLFMKISELTAQSIGDGVFEREEWDGEKQSVSLYAQTESGTADVELNIFERTLSEEELSDYISRFNNNADNLISGDNPDLMHVSSDLVLKEKYEGYPFKFVWRSSDPGRILSYSGSVDTSSGEGDVMLTAFYSYGEQEGEITIPVHVIVPEKDPARKYSEDLINFVYESESSGRESKEWILPGEFEGEKIRWEYKTEDNSLLPAGLFGIVAIVLFFASGKDLMSKAEQKKENMRKSYPKILRQIALYVGAGMTVKAAFTKIAEDSKSLQSGEMIYEEMRYACHEMGQGVGEANAYERFGNRTGLSEYIKLAGLLSQNLKRGNPGFVIRLRSEADNAMRERVLEARKAGEEAQTKLLVPMMMMLAVVMVMIMIPAMTGMNI